MPSFAAIRLFLAGLLVGPGPAAPLEVGIAEIEFEKVEFRPMLAMVAGDDWSDICVRSELLNAF